MSVTIVTCVFHFILPKQMATQCQHWMNGCIEAVYNDD
jgi:hypothetical protein